MKVILNKIKNVINNMDKTLLIVTIFLFLFGLFNIVTASSREAISNEVTLYYYFYRHLTMLGIGFFLSIIIIFTKTKKYKIVIPFFYVGISGLLIYLLTYGAYHKGAKNWIDFGGIKLQPSEFAKIISIIFLSIVFEFFYKKLKNKKTPNSTRYYIIGFILIVLVFIPILIYKQKDFGTMLIMLTINFIMFLASPLLKSDKFKSMLVFIFGGLLFVVMTVMVNGKFFTNEQMERFDYFNPCTKYEEGGYQVCNAFIAINNGGLTGLGIGKSKQKYSYISEPHTDSIFAIFVEEWGFIAAIFIFICYALVLGRVLTISSRAKTIRGRYITLGIAVYIFMHIFLNLGGLFGLIPLTGVPLPFLSYGGSFTICLMCSLTIVQRVCIETKELTAKEKK